MNPAAVRILLAKVGLDGHDRGIKVIARALRDAGFHVIYTGLHQTPEAVVQSALDEDVQVVGLSSLSGAHMTIFENVMRLFKEKNETNIVVFGGGIIPQTDIETLENMGVKKIFQPGTATKDVVQFLQENV